MESKEKWVDGSADDGGEPIDRVIKHKEIGHQIVNSFEQTEKVGKNV